MKIISFNAYKPQNYDASLPHKPSNFYWHILW